MINVNYCSSRLSTHTHTNTQPWPQSVRDRPQRQRCHLETLKKSAAVSPGNLRKHFFLDLTRSIFPPAPSRCPKLARAGDRCGSSDKAESQASRASVSSPAFCAPTGRKAQGKGRTFRASFGRPNMNQSTVPTNDVTLALQHVLVH